MHFAGLKAVQESVAQPLDYYDHNVIGSHRLLRAMQKTGVKKIVFSSSATVYGEAQYLPFDEEESGALLHVGIGGIVRDPSLYPMVEASIREACAATGLSVLDYFESPITGSDGNHEFFVYAQHRAEHP